MKIIIMGLNYSPEPTGNAPYTAALAEGLVRKGHNVQVIAGYPHYPEWRRTAGYGGWKRKEAINGVSVTRLRHYIPKRPKAMGRVLLELSFGLRLLTAKWGASDAIVMVSPALLSTAAALMRAKIGRRQPAVFIWVQDIYSCGIRETGTAAGTVVSLATRFESLLLRTADGVVVVHERFRDFLEGTLNVPANKLTTIRNWTHLPVSTVADRAGARRSLGWAEEDVIVLHAGNMGKKQGLENVVEAARLAAAQNSRVRFVLMGDGNQRRRLEEDAQGVGRISFADPLPQAAFQSALASADLLLVHELAGVKEMSIPSKLTSYYSAGVAVIAASEPGSVLSAELASSGGGLRVNPGDPSALLEGCENLGRDPMLRGQLSAAGLAYCQERLAQNTAITQYEAFIGRGHGKS